MIFITVEGTHEELLHFNIRKERYTPDVENKPFIILSRMKNNNKITSNKDIKDIKLKKKSIN